MTLVKLKSALGNSDCALRKDPTVSAGVSSESHQSMTLEIKWQVSLVCFCKKSKTPSNLCTV
eukprot:220626-Pelagomonas_calceolata.AAC.1